VSDPVTPTGGPGQGQGESTLTVVVAGLANLGIAAAKAVGAMISGSSAMLSEAAHSLADTVSQVLLFVALRRSTKPASPRHPLGHGLEAYLWAFLASLATFVAGAVFSILEGLSKIFGGEHEGSPTVSYVVLAVALAMESVSLVRALRQARQGARRKGMPVPRYLHQTTDPTVRAVTLEDAAAVAGILLAAAGLALTEATGSPVWDGSASIAIGLILVAVAVALAQSNSSLLIARSAPAAVVQSLRDDLEATPDVISVPVFVTTVLGPGQLLVAAKVEFADEATADDIERIADEAERRMIDGHPGVRHVFLDPTAPHAVSGSRGTTGG
jgi:cation diffusion facilitator family transporter